MHEKIAPYSAERNGSAERLNRVLEERFGQCSTIRVCPRRCERRPSVSVRAPWEAFFGEKPGVGLMLSKYGRASTRTLNEAHCQLD